MPEIWKKRRTIESLCCKIPLFGWFFVALCENDRFCRARSEISEQLVVRKRCCQCISDFQSREYGVDLAIAQQAGAAIMSIHGWPNSCFCRNDPLQLLIFDDDLNREIFDAIAKVFDCESESLLQYYDKNPGLTFGDLIGTIRRCIIIPAPAC